MEKKGEWSDVGANEILSEYEAFGRQETSADIVFSSGILFTLLHFTT